MKTEKLPQRDVKYPRSALDPKLNAFGCWYLKEHHNLNRDQYRQLLIQNGIIIPRSDSDQTTGFNPLK